MECLGLLHKGHLGTSSELFRLNSHSKSKVGSQGILGSYWEIKTPNERTQTLLECSSLGRKNGVTDTLVKDSSFTQGVQVRPYNDRTLSDTKYWRVSRMKTLNTYFRHRHIVFWACEWEGYSVGRERPMAGMRRWGQGRTWNFCVGFSLVYYKPRLLNHHSPPDNTGL